MVLAATCGPADAPGGRVVTCRTAAERSALALGSYDSMRGLCLAFVGVLALGFSACGDEEGNRRGAARPISHVSPAEITRLLEDRVGASEVHTGIPLAGKVEPEPVSSARMRLPGGAEFELLVFTGPPALRIAWPSVRRLAW